MKGLPAKATVRSKTGVLGVRHDPRRKAPWQATYDGKSLGWYTTLEQANYIRLHHEMHEIGVRPTRLEDYRKAGFSDEVIDKYWAVQQL